MVYDATKDWATGDQVSATQMDNIEAGIREGWSGLSYAKYWTPGDLDYSGNVCRFDLYTGKALSELRARAAIGSYTPKGLLMTPHGVPFNTDLQEEEEPLNANSATVTNDTVGSWATPTWNFAFPYAVRRTTAISGIWANLVVALKVDTGIGYIDDARIILYEYNSSGTQVESVTATASLVSGQQIGTNQTNFYKYVLSFFVGTGPSIASGNYLALEVQFKLRTSSTNTVYAFLNPGYSITPRDRAGGGVTATMMIPRSFVYLIMAD